MRPLTIGTRGSALARRQVELVLEALNKLRGPAEIRTLVIQTEGDRRTDTPLEEIGGQGVFVKDIEQRLLHHEIDIAVHSLKDMPAESHAGLAIAAVLSRADARDALVARAGRTLAELSPGARIGSDSKRRALQLQALRPDVEVTSIRGNVDTRLRKVDSGEYDAVVLAVAGLERLGLLTRATQVFSVTELLPAAGQGAIAVQCRADDTEVVALSSRLDDLATRHAVTAERAFLHVLGAGCNLPIGAYATVDRDSLRLDALLGDQSGQPHRASLQGPAAEAKQIGEALARQLRAEAGV